MIMTIIYYILLNIKIMNNDDDNYILLLKNIFIKINW